MQPKKKQTPQEPVPGATPPSDSAQDELDYQYEDVLPLPTVAVQCAKDPAFARALPHKWAIALKDTTPHAHELRHGQKLPLDMAALLLFRSWALDGRIKVVGEHGMTLTRPADRHEAIKCRIRKKDLAEFFAEMSLPLPAFWTSKTIEPPAPEPQVKNASTHAAATAEPSEPRADETTTHKLGTTRTHALAAVIATAKKTALDDADHHSVWAALVSLAESKDRPPPLLEHKQIEVDGIKYRAEKGVKFFNKDALRKMMDRAAKAAVNAH